MPEHKPGLGRRAVVHLLRGRNIARWLGAAIFLACAPMIYIGASDVVGALDKGRIPGSTTTFMVGWIGILIGAAILRFGFSGRKAAASVLECRECGAPNQAHAVYCGQCGGALRDVDRCGHCQCPVPHASKFCPNCGQEL